jgi:hypothetical protein
MASECEERDKEGKPKHKWRLAQALLMGAPLRYASWRRKEVCHLGFLRHE